MAARTGDYNKALGVLAEVHYSWDPGDDAGEDLTEVNLFFGEVCVFHVEIREMFSDLDDAITQALEGLAASLKK